MNSTVCNNTELKYEIAQWPKVSVIIPFYNNVYWLIEAIESVLIQKYSPIEILIINDGSSESLDVLDVYKEQIRIINKSNGGPASARNVGIQHSKGKYIAFLDSDDLWTEGKLYRQIYEMEKSNSVWSHHSYELFWTEGENVKNVDVSFHSGNVLIDTYISFKVTTDSIVILKSALEQNDIKYDESIRYGEDLDLYRKIGLLFPLLYVDGYYAKIRIRGGNAALNPKIQLFDKADSWERRQKSSNKVALPAFTSIGLFLCYLSSKVIRLIKNESLSKLISILLYIIPYLLFKTNFYFRSKKRGDT